eukprot:TRINITY_DN1226_c0_g1_i3.p1 TRINITY_DN1226_c0_g1~~TRINITY_DN1226_c0_g1_i3.p1  ORF type:complete len:769 (+),score=329.73 TRINITY_DN1226_c0_g1_i3:816-3122(+)
MNQSQLSMGHPDTQEDFPKPQQQRRRRSSDIGESSFKIGYNPVTAQEQSTTNQEAIQQRNSYKQRVSASQWQLGDMDDGDREKGLANEKNDPQRTGINSDAYRMQMEENRKQMQENRDRIRHGEVMYSQMQLQKHQEEEQQKMLAQLEKEEQERQAQQQQQQQLQMDMYSPSPLKRVQPHKETPEEVRQTLDYIQGGRVNQVQEDQYAGGRRSPYVNYSDVPQEVAEIQLESSINKYESVPPIQAGQAQEETNFWDRVPSGAESNRSQDSFHGRRNVLSREGNRNNMNDVFAYNGVSNDEQWGGHNMHHEKSKNQEQQQQSPEVEQVSHSQPEPEPVESTESVNVSQMTALEREMYMLKKWQEQQAAGNNNTDDQSNGRNSRSWDHEERGLALSNSRNAYDKDAYREELLQQEKERQAAEERRKAEERKRETQHQGLNIGGYSGYDKDQYRRELEEHQRLQEEQKRQQSAKTHSNQGLNIGGYSGYDKDQYRRELEEHQRLQKEQKRQSSTNNHSEQGLNIGGYSGYDKEQYRRELEEQRRAKEEQQRQKDSEDHQHHGLDIGGYSGYDKDQYRRELEDQRRAKEQRQNNDEDHQHHGLNIGGYSGYDKKAYRQQLDAQIAYSGESRGSTSQSRRSSNKQWNNGAQESGLGIGERSEQARQRERQNYAELLQTQMAIKDQRKQQEKQERRQSEQNHGLGLQLGGGDNKRQQEQEQYKQMLQFQMEIKRQQEAQQRQQKQQPQQSFGGLSFESESGNRPAARGRSNFQY